MADEKTTTPAPAKAKAAGGSVLVRLTSAGIDDSFRVGDPTKPEDQLVITPQGVEIDESKVADLLEIAQYNGVALTVGPVEQEASK